MDRNKTRQTRSLVADLQTRAKDDGEKVIEGYFAVFDSETELWPGAYEEIDPAAFDKTLSNDVRALIKDRKSTRLNSSHVAISYAVFCLKKKNNKYKKYNNDK